VKGHDKDLTQAVSAVDKVIGEVNTQAKQVEKEIHAACEKLRETVNEREAQLLSEVETVRHEKEKELVSQKHNLEFLLVGIRESTQFGEMLVKEGSESEIVASQKDVVSRLTTLGQGKEKSQMEPATDSTIVFEGDGGGLRQVGEAIKGFGSVVSRDISAEKSTVEGQPSGSVSINQAFSFRVIVVDKKGNRVTSSPKGKGIIPFVVEITLSGNQQQQQVENEEIQGKEGEFSQYYSLLLLLVSTRSLFLTREGISREVRLGLLVLISQINPTVVITTLLEPTLFFSSVPKGQEMASLTNRMVVLPATIQG